jgi:hypothetical protein
MSINIVASRYKQSVTHPVSFGSQDNQLMRAVLAEMNKVVKNESHAFYTSFLLGKSMYNFSGLSFDASEFNYNLLTSARSKGCLKQVGDVIIMIQMFQYGLTQENLTALSKALNVPLGNTSQELAEYRQGVKPYCPESWSDSDFAIQTPDFTNLLVKLLLYIKNTKQEKELDAKLKELAPTLELAKQALLGTASITFIENKKVL